MRVCYWDIETTDLKASFGRIICGSVYHVESNKMVTFRLDKYVRAKKATDMADDRQLCCDLRDEIEKSNVTCGWYSKGFDIPMLNTRLIKHGERRMKTMLHLDAIWYAKGWRGIKPNGASLAAVASFFGLDEGKMAVDADTWIDARHGSKKAMDIIQERCESDVRLTQEVTERLLDADVVKNIQTYP